jgi:hypothetical protein
MATTRHRWGGCLAVLLPVTVVVAACGSEPAILASGEIDGQPWRATVGTQLGEPGVCLIIDSSWRDAERLCGLDSAGTTWTVDATTAGPGFLAGTAQAGEIARTELSSGPVEAPVRGAQSLTSLRFWVIPLPAGESPTEVTLSAADGTPLEVRPLR